MRLLAVALACLLQLGCAPVLWTAGGVYVHATNRIDPLLGLALATQPVGFWASATYDIEEETYGSISVGISVPLLPGKP